MGMARRACPSLFLPPGDALQPISGDRRDRVGKREGLLFHVRSERHLETLRRPALHPQQQPIPLPEPLALRQRRTARRPISPTPANTPSVSGKECATASCPASRKSASASCLLWRKRRTATGKASPKRWKCHCVHAKGFQPRWKWNLVHQMAFQSRWKWNLVHQMGFQSRWKWNLLHQMAFQSRWKWNLVHQIGFQSRWKWNLVDPRPFPTFFKPHSLRLQAL